MPAEHTRITGWMWDRFQSDATLRTGVGGRIYADEAPQGAAAPMLLYAFLGGSDQLVGASRLANALYLVRIVGDGTTYGPIEDLADRADNLLTSIGVGGTYFRDIHINSCTREQPHQRKDSSLGVPSVYLGGFYRVRWELSL